MHISGTEPSLVVLSMAENHVSYRWWGNKEDKRSFVQTLCKLLYHAKYVKVLYPTKLYFGRNSSIYNLCICKICFADNGILTCRSYYKYNYSNDSYSSNEIFKWSCVTIAHYLVAYLIILPRVPTIHCFFKKKIKVNFI